MDAADASDIAAVLELAHHDKARVRKAVALVMPLLTHGEAPTEAMIAAAIRLTTDPKKRVRDYACFALAEQWREVDTAELREALAARLDDVDRDTRCEALVGLAFRHDPRALPRVHAALARPSGDLRQLELVAAGALGDPRLHELVQRHQDGWSAKGTRTASAVSRLTDPAGPGDDLIEGVAQLYRRRVRSEAEDDGLDAWRVMLEMLDMAPHRASEFLDAVLDQLADDEQAQRQVREASALAQMAAEA
ncbi:MAG TPA: HEAT repeat domain-containing protein [Nocardioides sp.]|nr:HEAT repeat domain-containing protein [Nocardioides sp.]